MDRRRSSQLKVKRLIDISGAVVSGIVALPIVLTAAAVIRAQMGSPVLFRQRRPGLAGHEFTLYKLRTMSSDTGPTGKPLPDGARLTPLGAKMRRWSVDELPELWNVLKGDMSLVGPRPLLVEYLDLYTDEQMRRHEMRPGLTGLAQVNGRNAQSWEERLAMDLWYVDHWSVWLDLKILVLTVAKVLGGDGVSAEGVVTMPRFEGTSEHA